MDVQRFTIEVAVDHPAFDGHFPGHPVLPGVVLLAEVVAGVERHLGLATERLEIKVAKFHAPVAPGSRLDVELVPGSSIAFSISCGATRVASGSLAPAPAADGGGNAAAGSLQ